MTSSYQILESCIWCIIWEDPLGSGGWQPWGVWCRSDSQPWGRGQAWGSGSSQGCGRGWESSPDPDRSSPSALSKLPRGGAGQVLNSISAVHHSVIHHVHGGKLVPQFQKSVWIKTTSQTAHTWQWRAAIPNWIFNSALNGPLYAAHCELLLLLMLLLLWQLTKWAQISEWA